LKGTKRTNEWGKVETRGGIYEWSLRKIKPRRFDPRERKIIPLFPGPYEQKILKESCTRAASVHRRRLEIDWINQRKGGMWTLRGRGTKYDARAKMRRGGTVCWRGFDTQMKV